MLGNGRIKMSEVDAVTNHLKVLVERNLLALNGKGGLVWVGVDNYYSAKIILLLYWIPYQFQEF